MKILKTFLYIMLILLVACEKDETIAVIKTDGTPAVITSTGDDLSVDIDAETLAGVWTVKWNETDYGIQTEVKYNVELDMACGDFSSPVVVGTTANSTIDIPMDVLNSKVLNDLMGAQHLSQEVQLRVSSSIRNGYPQVSEPVVFTITPWKVWSKGLWLVSDSYTDANSPVIYQGNGSAFDGYAFINKDNSFRFANTRTCGKTTFGGGDGQLSSETSAPDLNVGTSGYYRVKSDPENLTYELTLIESFGLIGTATAGGWNSSTPLTYNEAAQTWEATVDLVSGALKFRANDNWGINYGPGDGNSLEGALLLDDPGAISIQEPGTYTVVLDFSKKKAPAFSYSVKKTSAAEAPATLWLPGEYGWNPAAAPTIKAINSSTFEGYVYISSPTGYKFTSAPDWDHINYGDAGTEGALTTDGLANSLGLAEAGYYKFNVNVNALTYSATLINTMGMIGTATPGSWDSSSPLTYDQANDVWKATINLVPGALKFRANNAWTINYGPADSGALEGALIFDDPGAINITEAGSYTVTVDFSRGEAPYKYTYTVLKN